MSKRKARCPRCGEIIRIAELMRAKPKDGVAYAPDEKGHAYQMLPCKCIAEKDDPDYEDFGRAFGEAN
ncbi:MAG TPA: hypothetical protein VGY66_36515 [Gemmataceae bacterium]|jgi:hypothetical protein|nr:hypothetical protein [Gemmataceae bacterium]